MRANTNTHIRFGCLNSNKQSPYIRSQRIRSTTYYVHDPLPSPHPTSRRRPYTNSGCMYWVLPCQCNQISRQCAMPCWLGLVTPFTPLFDISNKILYSQAASRSNIFRHVKMMAGDIKVPLELQVFYFFLVRSHSIRCQSSLLSGAHTDTSADLHWRNVVVSISMEHDFDRNIYMCAMP